MITYELVLAVTAYISLGNLSRRLRRRSINALWRRAWQLSDEYDVDDQTISIYRGDSARCVYPVLSGTTSLEVAKRFAFGEGKIYKVIPGRFERIIDFRKLFGDSMFIYTLWRIVHEHVYDHRYNKLFDRVPITEGTPASDVEAIHLGRLLRMVRHERELFMLAPVCTFDYLFERVDDTE